MLARPSSEGAPQNGISYFICPMDAPGIEVRPLVDMTGEHTFNEVFGTTRNPWDPSRSAGGSSGGAVAQTPMFASWSSTAAIAVAEDGST